MGPPPAPGRASVQVAETSVTVNNSPIQDYLQPDDHTYQ